MTKRDDKPVVQVYAGTAATVPQMAALILRLPYLDAIELASAIGADVDKMIDGAKGYLDV
jgi:hypothetical protein